MLKNLIKLMLTVTMVNALYASPVFNERIDAALKESRGFPVNPVYMRIPNVGIDRLIYLLSSCPTGDREEKFNNKKLARAWQMSHYSNWNQFIPTHLFIKNKKRGVWSVVMLPPLQSFLQGVHEYLDANSVETAMFDFDLSHGLARDALPDGKAEELYNYIKKQYLHHNPEKNETAIKALELFSTPEFRGPKQRAALALYDHNAKMLVQGGTTYNVLCSWIRVIQHEVENKDMWQKLFVITLNDKKALLYGGDYIAKALIGYFANRVDDEIKAEYQRLQHLIENEDTKIEMIVNMFMSCLPTQEAENYIKHLVRAEPPPPPQRADEDTKYPVYVNYDQYYKTYSEVQYLPMKDLKKNFKRLFFSVDQFGNSNYQ